MTATLVAMDLTPDLVRGIEFRRKGRGYDTEEVDKFRQAVATWAEEAQARLREATSKLDEAETRAREAEERSRTHVESDETIQRTLLLAQRTADAAVAEAEETAGRKVAEAERTAGRTVADAEAESERLLAEARGHRERAIAEAEAEVRETLDLKRAEMLDELTTLERVRDDLTGDVAVLESHLEDQRSRVQDARDLLGVLLNDPGALAPVAAPELSDMHVPEPAPRSELFLEPLAEPESFAPEVLSEPLGPDLADEATAVEAEPPGGAPTAPSESVFGETPGTPEALADDWSTASEDTWADTPPPPPPPPPGPEVDEAAWADAPPPPPPPPDFDVPAEPGAEGAAGSFGGLSGPAVPEQLPDLNEQAEDDNPWLAELTDQEADAEDGERSRFGRRR